MPQILPPPTSAWDKYEVPLNGTVYIFEWQKNTRDSGIRFTLSREEGIVKSGLRVMYSDVGLLSAYRKPLFSHGDIYCVKNTLTTDNPSLENLGIDYNLYYLTNEEIDELEATR